MMPTFLNISDTTKFKIHSFYIILPGKPLCTIIKWQSFRGKIQTYFNFRGKIQKYFNLTISTSMKDNIEVAKFYTKNKSADMANLHGFSHSLKDSTGIQISLPGMPQ